MSARDELTKLVRAAPSGMTIADFQADHQPLFAQMQQEGINSTAFWMCLASGHDPVTHEKQSAGERPAYLE